MAWYADSRDGALLELSGEAALAADLIVASVELMFKHNTPKKVIITEYLSASENFLEKIQIGYLNAILDKIANVLRKDE